MEITTDILLRGEDWEKAIYGLKEIFSERTNYEVFMMALSIGIMFDKQITIKGPSEHSVPRNVIVNNDNGKLDDMFQVAVLTTSRIDMSEDDRIKLAFGDKDTSFNKIEFLSYFANYGVTKLVELIGDSTLQTLGNLQLCFHQWAVMSVEDETAKEYLSDID